MTFARLSDGIQDSLAMSGSPVLAKVGRRLDRLAEDHVIWVVLIVAVAIIAAVGLLVYAMTYCVSHGRSFQGGLTVISKSWWDIRIGFYCS